jgi:transposase
MMRINDGRKLNREAQAQIRVIKRIFKVSMSGVSVWRTPKALGMSAQRPKHIAYQQKEEAAEEFLRKQLLFKQENPVFFIVDGHPVHKSKKVKEYVESTGGRLTLFYLPGYSPELNPDETVWSYVKHHVVGKKIITGPEQFLKVVKDALYSLMHKPTIISAFFRNPSLQYI